jgi:enoyl-[acyl-carrier-protein] reductase (NADH)
MTPEAFRKSAIPTEQVAEVVAFLASPAADGITGEPIRVFGRQDMYWYGSGKMALVQAVAN